MHKNNIFTSMVTIIKPKLCHSLQQCQQYSTTFSKLKLSIIAISLFSISIISCEKVIDVELNESDKKYVIEGTISNISGTPAEVRLSETKAFNDQNNFNGISGATVTIQVSGGTTYTLTQTAQGIYRSSAFTGTPGTTYNLSVSINGNTFTATSTMPQQLVTLDTLTVSTFAFGGNSSRIVSPAYKDPIGLGNSYRLIQYVNSTLVKRVFVQNDELSDGLTITRPMINPDSDVSPGNLVKVDLLCIDPNVYKYWYSLDQASTGTNQNATPANPVSNINGGALGYFSAHSVTSKTIVVP
jgi:hypothetical protein